MIDYISDKMLSYLLKNNAILNDEYDRGHYKYGIEITISSLMNIILVMTLGVIFSKIEFSTIFLLLFISVRQFTGGYHAKTYFRCNLTMCVSFCSCVFATDISIDIFSITSLIIHMILSSIIILEFCPVSNENKPIKIETRNKYKITSFILSNLFSVFGYFIYHKNKEIGLFVIMTIIIINVLVIISKLAERRKSNE